MRGQARQKSECGRGCLASAPALEVQKGWLGVHVRRVAGTRPRKVHVHLTGNCSATQ